MILNLNIVIAYICPLCSEVSTKELTVFDFSGEKAVSAICGNEKCGELCVTILPKKDKYKIDIDCPICGDTHSFNISKNVFWTKDLFTLKCPVSNIDIYFLGNYSDIKKALDEQSEFLSSFDDEEIEEDDDMNILYEIAECIKSIALENNIYCKCGNHKISITIVDDGLLLVCNKCGSKKNLPSSEETLSMLLNASAVVLDNKKH